MEISAEKVLDFLKDRKRKDFIVFSDKPYLVTVKFDKNCVYIQVDEKDVLIFDKKSGDLLYEKKCKVINYISDIINSSE